MVQQAVLTDVTTTNIRGRVGWLVWWTIRTHTVFDVAALRAAAQRAGLPAQVCSRLVGRGSRSAWTVATQLGAKGLTSPVGPGDPPDSLARYYTRDIDAGVRAIVREVVDARGVRVATEQVATLTYHAHNGVAWSWCAPAQTGARVQPEVQVIVQQMQLRFQQLVGNMDASRVRQVVLDWLETRYRVALRGTGGVYFVPCPLDPAAAQAVQAELAGLRDWLTAEPVRGVFSYAELAGGGASSLDDVVAAAVGEIKAGLEDIDANLERYTTTRGMNSGSLLFSASEMAGRLEKLRGRMATLQNALGEPVGVAEAMLQMVEKRAAGLVKQASTAIAAERLAKQAKPASIGEPAAQNGKSGTVQERRAVHKIE